MNIKGFDLRLSVFGDEIAEDLHTQLRVLDNLAIHYIEVRSIWGKNILAFDNSELQSIKDELDRAGLNVSAIGSPIGKSALAVPLEFEVERLDKAIAVAKILRTQLIRIFSFFVPPELAVRDRDCVVERLTVLTEYARNANVILVHENSPGTYGDSIEHCLDVQTSINSPALRMAFDPGGFVQCAIKPIEAWKALANWVIHVHIKDMKFADGKTCLPGRGDGDISRLLHCLAQRDYPGFLTIEPHLQESGLFGGFSGIENVQLATQALRSLL